MSATENQINSYLYNIRVAYSKYGSKLANAQRIGVQNLECQMLKFRTLKYLIRIMVDYFDSPDYENINFFTKEEAKDIMQHINNICNTNHIVEL